MKFFRKVYLKFKWFFAVFIFRDKFLLAAHNWFKDQGDSTHRKLYPLDKNSIVFDVGGYKGEFAEDIYDRYGCSIYVFEPVKDFYNEIIEKFIGNSKVHVYDFGLADEDSVLEICLADDGSSIYDDKNDKYEQIYLKSFLSFCKENHIEHIDLLKINIEGGEFPLLFALLDSPILSKIKNLQIQFHLFVNDAEEMRDEIRSRLIKTHHITYDYYFIWENWELNEV